MNLKRFGIDAPFALLVYTVFGIGLLSHAYLNRFKYPITIEVILGAVLLLGAIIFLHTTVRGKYRIFDVAVKSLKLQPQDQILDLGCGRGALLTRLARGLQGTGKVTGLDLWLSRDQSHNKQAIAQKNVVDLGLEDHVELVTGDMTKLDFSDDYFDVVTSSFAVHNIKSVEARQQAIKEAIRVLKPDGQLLIIDTDHHLKEYQQVMAAGDLTITQAAGLGINGWWATPLTGSYLVLGKKPLK
ncbi:SAM-dependent methyltransferase [Lactobacillus pentosus] [Lactiplantibacillus mudanjiangensis]|uniref:class I SAM-dependent methyltransferase n=1 Tax=Lactiplantibacillus mudanjiangensis TaxID=1296538 RepID=UPI001014BE87|nr:methyltransferase domain-containing protein [Lactiplantibacillus mudanjiangensis]VDG33894.1 SAM-dependent methyltransferase [Lactobacillus pentosus] [Lactiplantibacillus mudanjiangensis]